MIQARFFRKAFILVLTASLAACASRPGPEVLETVAAVESPEVRRVKVYTVTTRNRVKPASNIFDAGKSPHTNYAELTVSIPPGHKQGMIEWPGKKPDPKKSFAVVEQEVLDQATFLHKVKATGSEPKRIGIFVHGYNYNFQESIFRLAQMVADSAIEGEPILFSWPSQGSVAGYVADKEAATYSRDHLARLLTELTEASKQNEVFVFAHSMGGWLTVEALRQLRLQGRTDVLDRLHVVLAAPDIDEDVFRVQTEVIGRMKNPLTILVSADDRALAVSKILSASTQRVGTLDVTDPKVQEVAVAYNIQIIDISAIKGPDATNHSRFVDAAALYPALTARTQTQGLNEAGAFVFDAAAATISSPFRIVSGVLKQQ